MHRLFIDLPTLLALLALVAGTWILVAPQALNYAVAIYLLATGGLGLIFALQAHHLPVQPVVALAAGILVLIQPQFLNYVVAFYLIALGIAGLLRW